jgi:hypothetical protein
MITFINEVEKDLKYGMEKLYLAFDRFLKNKMKFAHKNKIKLFKH